MKFRMTFDPESYNCNIEVVDIFDISMTFGRFLELIPNMICRKNLIGVTDNNLYIYGTYDPKEEKIYFDIRNEFHSISKMEVDFSKSEYVSKYATILNTVSMLTNENIGATNMYSICTNMNEYGRMDTVMMILHGYSRLIIEDDVRKAVNKFLIFNPYKERNQVIISSVSSKEIEEIFTKEIEKCRELMILNSL